MKVIIIHRNSAFSICLKEYFNRKGSVETVVANDSALSNGLQEFLKDNNDQTRVILDAHITGNMSDCEGCNWINKLRLVHGIMSPVILLSWFSWPFYFKTKTYLSQHLDWFFMYGYEKKKMSNPIILKLPCTPEEIYKTLIKF